MVTLASEPARPTVLFFIRGETVARALLRSDVTPRLLDAGVNIAVAAPKREEAWPVGPGDPPLEVEVIRPAARPEEPSVKQRLGHALSRIRWLSLDGRRCELFREKYVWARARREGWWVSAPGHVVITQVLWRSRLLRRLVASAEDRLVVADSNAHLFERFKPDLVVAGGFGYFDDDEAVLREASQRGIRTASVISRWDNPTSKGYRGADPDLVSVWSETMRRQVVDLHDIPPERVVISGAPQWDIYLRPDELPARDELFESLGLDPARKLVVHATSSPRVGRLNIETARCLIAAVDGGALGPGVQLLIRPHPKYVLDDADDPYEAFAELAEMRAAAEDSPNVTMALPDRDLYWGREDQRHLAALLKHCDVVVNHFSTTTLEAFAVDRPVVFADLTDLPVKGLGPEARREWEDYGHLETVVAQRAAPVAKSPQALVEMVRAYLDDPSLDASARRNVVEQEWGPVDGLSGHRVAELFMRELGLSPDQTQRGTGQPPAPALQTP